MDSCVAVADRGAGLAVEKDGEFYAPCPYRKTNTLGFDLRRGQVAS
jgi:hypothetical protein